MEDVFGDNYPDLSKQYSPDYNISITKMKCPHCKEDLKVSVENLFIEYDLEQINMLKCKNCDTAITPYYSRLPEKIDNIKRIVSDLGS